MTAPWIALVILVGVVAYGASLWTIRAMQLQCYRNAFTNLDPNESWLFDWMFCCIFASFGPLGIVACWLIWQQEMKSP